MFFGRSFIIFYGNYFPVGKPNFLEENRVSPSSKFAERHVKNGSRVQPAYLNFVRDFSAPRENRVFGDIRSSPFYLRERQKVPFLSSRDGSDSLLWRNSKINLPSLQISPVKGNIRRTAWIREKGACFDRHNAGREIRRLPYKCGFPRARRGGLFFQHGIGGIFSPLPSKVFYREIFASDNV